MTSSAEDDTFLEEDLEERRSRLLGVAKLFGGVFVTGAIVALVIGLVVGMFILIGPNLVKIEPGTTPVPEATPTVRESPTPVQTLTRLPFGPQPS